MVDRLCTSLGGLSLSAIRRYTALAAEREDCIVLTIGEPDLPTPAPICEAAVRALAGGSTHYTANQGSASLRAKLAAYEAKTRQLDYTPDEIIVTAGATEAIYCALTGVLDPGDEVIVFSPYFPMYREQIELAGGVCVDVPTYASEDYAIDEARLRAAITPRTKAIVFNNPTNPTGMGYDSRTLELLARVAQEHDLLIAADEIYTTYLYEGNFRPIRTLPGMAERTIVVNGFSKAYAMTGWRIGYSLSPALVAKAMTNYLSHSTGAPGTMCQCAAIEALSGPQDEAEQMRQVFEQRRDLIVRRINAMPGVSCLKPSGAFYVMMNLEQILGKQIDGQIIGSGDDFAKLLLEKSLVAVVPGSGFGAPNFVRLSYAISTENIETGMDRLEGFLKQLQ